MLLEEVRDAGDVTAMLPLKLLKPSGHTANGELCLCPRSTSAFLSLCGEFPPSSPTEQTSSQEQLENPGLALPCFPPILALDPD